MRTVEVRPWSDLQRSSGWPSLLELIQTRRQELLTELRGAVRAGNTTLAARKEGGLEELERFLADVRRNIAAEQDVKPHARTQCDPFAVPVR